MPVDEVGQLLQRWRGAGGLLGRGRIVADGMRLLRGLDPDERRVLARALAEDGAPDLASRIEGQTGRAIDVAELQQVADGLLALDRDQVEHLAATLADPDERTRLAHEALRGSPGGPPAPPSPAPPPHVPPGADPEGVAGQHALARNDEGASARESDLALGQPGLGEATLSEVTLTDVALSEPRVLDVAPYAEVPEAAAPAQASAGEGGPDEAPPPPAADTTGPSGRPAGVTVPEPATHHLVAPAGPGEVHAPVTDVAPLVSRLRHAASATARFAVLSPEGLDGVDADGALRLLDAMPQGWQRRRAAQRLIAAGALAGVDPARVLSRFPGTTDATFVAGGLLDAGVCDLSGLGDAVPARVRRRFAARSGR